MNLVAKEYVACQIHPTPGVLILSPFAGAGGTMTEALLVNPYEVDLVAETIHKALCMEPEVSTFLSNFDFILKKIIIIGIGTENKNEKAEGA